VIIDEACQAVETSALIPLRCGAKKCILVGDPKQLPPTVLSSLAKEKLFDQSLFERILKQFPKSANMLTIQYRMHPELSVFPSTFFYDSRLKDGPDVLKNRAAEWHSHRTFQPYRVYDIPQGREETGSGHSYYNCAEVASCVDLVKVLSSSFPTTNVFNFLILVLWQNWNYHILQAANVQIKGPLYERV
jgi:senataxin